MRFITALFATGRRLEHGSVSGFRVLPLKSRIRAGASETGFENISERTRRFRERTQAGQ